MLHRKGIRRIACDILIQIVPVTLGVYLGILASNRNETRKETELTRKVVGSLIREVDFNRTPISGASPTNSAARVLITGNMP